MSDLENVVDVEATDVVETPEVEEASEVVEETEVAEQSARSIIKKTLFLRRVSCYNLVLIPKENVYIVYYTPDWSY